MRHHGKPIRVRTEPITDYADLQLRWDLNIESLRRGRYLAFDAASLSIHGDAPKCFVKIQQHTPGQPGTRVRDWVSYIAKVGNKFYPTESITEHLITRVGQAFRFKIADSELRIIGRQVRFLSRFFRGSDESLLHGIEIFKRHLMDDDFVEEVAATKAERDVYTFQTVREALKSCFPEHWQEMLNDMVAMLAFDALVGKTIDTR
jgi:hypothetical protein